MFSFSNSVRRINDSGPFGLVLLMLVLVLPRPVLAQAESDQQEPEGQRIYRQAYETAMADSIISPDEEQMLKALHQALGLHEDVVAEAFGAGARPLAPALEQSGRWTLVAQNMAWGLGLYGWGIPYLLGADYKDTADVKWLIGGEMLSLAATFYLTWKYTEQMDLPEARSHLQRYGGMVGLQYGRALNILLGYWDNDDPDRGEVLVLMSAVPVGIYVGDRLYRRWRPSTGMAYALSLCGELGATIMCTFHQQFAPQPDSSDYGTYVGDNGNGGYVLDEKEAYDAADLKWRKQRLLFSIVGYPFGTYLGHKLFAQRRYTFGDAALLTVGRGAGAWYGVLLSELFGLYDDGHNQAIPWITTAGGLGGLWAADRFMRGEDYTFGQTAMLTLGGVAGGAFAFGLGVLADIDFESNYYEPAAIGGSLAGFFLTRRVIIPQPERAVALGTRQGPRIDLSLQPAWAGGEILPALAIEARW